ncbi:MAG: NAAT family transporter [candidate division Zixibacteria bacterium]|nr:NAAT family transporter [candidate division Zixibacteria bacterium]
MEMLHWHDYLEMLTAIIVIVDPLGAVPIFIGLTAEQSEHERAHTARVAVFSAGIVLVIACLLGAPLLKFFGIRIASFQIAGGILIFVLAMSMLNARISPAKQTQEEATEAVGKENVAVVPLAIPLLAGPAAISTIIIYAHRQEGWMIRGFLILAIAITIALVWILWRVSIPLSRRLGRTGMNNVTRVMGLLLAAIAVEFVAGGLGELFPFLK